MGSGFKDFSPGGILTAADVDGYLMRQGVMTFASAAARDSALSGVLDEGMVVYLEDTDRLEVYTEVGMGSDGMGDDERTDGLFADTGSEPIDLQQLVDSDLVGHRSAGHRRVHHRHVVDHHRALRSRRVVHGVRPVALASATNGLISIVGGGVNHENSYTSPATAPAFAALIPLSATNTVTASVYQSSGGALNVTASLQMYRIGR